MPRYEFKVIPAPRRGEKARGVKTTEERFALSLTNVMNAQGAEGWDYVRADTLPVDERAGFTGTKTSFHNMLVFRRILEADASLPDTRLSAIEPLQTAPRKLGPAEAPTGTAPAIAPVKPEIAAE